MADGYAQTWRCSPRQSRDPASGRRVTQWTDPAVPSQHLYFTSPSVTVDDRWLVGICDRDGQANLFAIDRVEKVCHQLTDNHHGTRVAYCYPYGSARGLARPTPSLDPIGNRLFALIDDEVVRIDLQTGQSRPLWRIPPNSMPAFTHVSPDGRKLVMPLTNADVFGDPTASQAEQMERLARHIDAGRVRTTLWVIDTETGEARPWLEVGFWLTHVQFDPTGSGWGIFNSEGHWHQQAKIPRLWVAEPDGTHRPLVKQAEGEMIGHENFAPDGTVVYHGIRDGAHYVARRKKSGECVEELRSCGIAVHHTTPAAGGNGYIADAYDGAVYHIVPDGQGGTRATVLCRHDTEGLGEQDNHAHAITTPAGGSVIFTANRAGVRSIYEVAMEVR